MQDNLAVMWLLFCTFLVYMMQLGFLFLESGLVRKKNNSSVAFKNLVDFSFNFVIFSLFGYSAYIGLSHFGFIGEITLTDFKSLDSLTLVQFLYMGGFSAATGTIVSGAIAERMNSIAYSFLIGVIAIFCFPFVAHWVWNENGFLSSLGFIDLAGGSVVHGVGGMAALAAVLVIGKRKDVDLLKGIRPSPSNNVELVFGAFLLIICWMGFNAGSETLPNKNAVLIIINTLVACTSGFIMIYLIDSFKKTKSIPRIVNGSLAGIVAITACAHLGNIYTSILLGGVAALLVSYLEGWLSKRVDDVVGAISVHLGGGVIGILAAPIISLVDNPLSFSGFLRSFGVQVLGLVLILIWVFIIIYLFLKIINRFILIRVSSESEDRGLNFGEFGIKDELGKLLEEVDEQIVKKSFENKVHIEPFTVVGEIASKYNTVTSVVCTLLEKEKDLQEQVVLASTLSATGVMASGLAHEINNPLSIIDLTVGSLKKCLRKPEINKELIENTIKRISRITVGLRNISRDAEKDEESIFSVKEVFDDTMCIAEEKCRQTNIKLIYDFTDEESSISLLGNRVQISQVLINLYNNAYDSIEKMEDDKWIKFKLKEEEGFLEIRIIDCGLGIEKSIITKIFNPFFTTKDIGKGTGLGLSISKKMMERCGGKLSYELYDSHTSFVLKVKRG